MSDSETPQPAIISNQPNVVIRARRKVSLPLLYFNRFLAAVTQLRTQVEFLRHRLVRRLQKIIPPIVAEKLGLFRHDETKQQGSSDENQVRGNWSNQVEFVISCIGFAVGLGNVWRFPYVCYRNGGGAFLIIYWILSAVLGFPVMVLEQSLGQYTSQGPLHCWQFAPVVTGAGMAMVAVTFLTAIYYNIIIVWSFYYLFASVTTRLPWESCDFSDWADYRCEMPTLECSPGSEHLRGIDGLCYNRTTIGLTKANLLLQGDLDGIARNSSTVLGLWNETFAANYNIKSVLATDQFYHNYVLGNGDPSVGWDNYGFPRWSLVLILLLDWCVIFFTELNGIKSSGKVVYFTALGPYAVLLVLIVRGATLPGAYQGIMYFLLPDFELLKSPKVWYAAACQLFYSLSICWGGMIALASYNRFQNNVIRDALIVTFADSFTSFIASFAVFSILGHGAFLLGRRIEDVAEAGAGMAFVLYPKILSQLPGAVGFSIIFFLMLVCIGISTTFNHVQTIFTTVLDIFPRLRSNPRNKHATLFAVCVLCFLLGIPFLCPGGPGLLQVFDDYAATWAVLMVGVIETIAICWVYGFWRYTKDLRLMMNWLPVWPAYIIEVCLWGFITPGVLTFIMFFTWINYKPRSSGVEEGVGWLLTWFVAIWMPLVAIWVIATRKGTFWQRLVAAFRPTEKWGPFLDRFRSQAKHLHRQTSRSQTAPGALASPEAPKATEESFRAIHRKQSDEIPTAVSANFMCRSIETFELGDCESRQSRHRIEESQVTVIPVFNTSASSPASTASGSWTPSVTSRVVMVDYDIVHNL